MSNLDLRRKWNGAVEWLHDELERVSTQCIITSPQYAVHYYPAPVIDSEVLPY